MGPVAIIAKVVLGGIARTSSLFSRRKQQRNIKRTTHAAAAAVFSSPKLVLGDDAVKLDWVRNGVKNGRRKVGSNYGFHHLYRFALIVVLLFLDVLGVVSQGIGDTWLPPGDPGSGGNPGAGGDTFLPACTNGINSVDCICGDDAEIICDASATSQCVIDIAGASGEPDHGQPRSGCFYPKPCKHQVKVDPCEICDFCSGGPKHSESDDPGEGEHDGSLALFCIAVPNGDESKGKLGKADAPGGLRKVVLDWHSGGTLQNTVLATYGNISEWDTSQVTTLKNVFCNITHLNEDLSKWVVSSVTDMESSKLLFTIYELFFIKKPFTLLSLSCLSLAKNNKLTYVIHVF
jgi:hypothetical protein